MGCIENNFLTQVTESPNRREPLLDLLVTNAEELIGEVKTGGILFCSDHALVESMISRDIGQVNSIVKTLNIEKVKFQFFKGSGGWKHLGICPFPNRDLAAA